MSKEHSISLISSAVRRGTTMPIYEKDTRWDIDAPVNGRYGMFSYNNCFKEFLEQDGANDFTSWLVNRRSQGQSTHVLDLFGAARFIEDPTIADSITGVRLLDNSEDLINRYKLHGRDRLLSVVQRNNPEYVLSKKVKKVVTTLQKADNYGIVEGNLYTGKVWRDLDANRQARGIEKYDLIVVKPEHVFDDEEVFSPHDGMHAKNKDVVAVYSEIYLRMLQRAYSRLSTDQGTMMVQVPEFISLTSLDAFAEMLREKGNLSVAVTDSNLRYDDIRERQLDEIRNLKVVKNPDSVPDLQALVAEHMPAA